MQEKSLYFYPMKMQPIYKDYLWGGKKLKSFNKTNDAEITAESWEVSCNEAGLSKIANGKYKGKTLKEVVEYESDCFLGENAAKYKGFPIIVKLIDADKDLSIQVHPSEDDAQEIKGESGKTELWYIIDCNVDSYVYYGFKKDVSKKELLKYIEEKKVCELINKVKVKKGEAYYIPAGTIHALGKGIVVAEIQQNSNTTFRVYDYDRKDAKGNQRQLHIDRAKDVLNLKRTDPKNNLKEHFKTFKCEYFKIDKYIIDAIKEFDKDDKTFNVIQFIEGKGLIIHNGIMYEAQKGDSFFIPAKIKNYTVKGSCEMLITQI